MADPKLTIRIGAELAEIRRALQTVGNDINNLKTRAARPVGGDALGMNRALSGAVGLVKGLAGAFVGLEGLRAFVRIADQAATMNAQLRLATESQEEFNRAYQGTFDIAQRSRTSLQATVDLYTRLERSTRDLAVNQDTLLALTETINQAAQLSGGGQGAEAALFQLSQGLAAGALRGEELNSVLEQTPRLAQAIADGLDMPIGQLRKYAQEGKLTAEQVARALISQRETLQREFSELPRTVSGAMTQLGNQVSRIVERINSEGGFTDALVAGLDALGVVLNEIGTLVVNWSRAFRQYFGELGALIQQSKEQSGEFGLVLDDALGNAADLFRRVVRELQILPVSLRTVVSILIGEFAKLVAAGTLQFLKLLAAGQRTWAGIELAASLAWAKVREVVGTGVDFALRSLATLQRQAAGLASATGADDLAQRLNAAADGYERLGGFARDAQRDARVARDVYAASIQGINDNIAQSEAELRAKAEEADAYILDALQERERALKGLEDQAKATGTAVGSIGIDPSGGGGAGAAVARSLELVRDAVARALEELDRLYSENEISLREYFRRKEQLELQAVDAAIAQAREELRVANTQQEQVKALTEIEKLQRDRAEIGPRVAREQAAAEEELARRLTEVRARLLEAEGQSAEARALRLQEEFRDLRERLTAEGDQAGLALVDKLVNVEQVRARLQQLQTEIDTALGGLRDTEANVAARVELGDLSGVEAENQLNRVRDQSLAKLRQLRDAMREFAAATKDPEVLRALQRLDTEIAQVEATNSKLVEGLKDAAASSLQGFFTDLASGAKSFGDAAKDAARAFASAVAQMIAQELALAAVRAALRAFSTAHGGMRVTGGGGMRGRMLNPAIFNAAPRYHDGGIVGLKANEVPAILQTGEEVLSRTDPRNAANGGLNADRGGGGGFRVVNVIDPSMVEDYLESSAGERTILNVIGRNPGAVKQLIG